MSISLHLALDVLDTVEEALESGERLDLEAEAERLLVAHPEAGSRRGSSSTCFGTSRPPRNARCCSARVR